MHNVLLAAHIIAICVALGGRILFIPLFSQRAEKGFNERLDELQEILTLSRIADLGLTLAIALGIALFLMQGVPLNETTWSFKLKLVTTVLLLTNIGAFHVAQMRVINHYDSQMVPALKRLNTLAVVLMCCMVLFATFSI